jgi:hypothetical protein
MKKRPWIWVIIAHLAMIGILATVVVIATKNAPQEVRVSHER